jgi:hypothetical protein
LQPGPEKEDQIKPGRSHCPLLCYQVQFCLILCPVCYHFCCLHANKGCGITGEANKFKGSIYMVFEYMDHDLTGLSDRPGMRFSVPQIKVGLKSDELAVSIYPFHFMPSQAKVFSDLFHVHGGYSAT